MDNLTLLKKIVDIFNTGDITEIELVFSNAYIDHQRPEWMDSSGSEEFKQIVELARKSLSNLKVTAKDTISEGNKISARLHWSGMNSEGKDVERETIDILRFENGKAVEHWGAEEWTSQK